MCISTDGDMYLSGGVYEKLLGMYKYIQSDELQASNPRYGLKL